MARASEGVAASGFSLRTCRPASRHGTSTARCAGCLAAPRTFPAASFTLPRILRGGGFGHPRHPPDGHRFVDHTPRHYGPNPEPAGVRALYPPLPVIRRITERGITPPNVSRTRH